MSVRTVVQHGPKEKRIAAFALDWPGWGRGAKTPVDAVETLEAYRPRYRPVAGLAGLEAEFDAAGPLDIVEDHVGTGSTDFWGISFAPSSFEHGPMTDDDLDRRLGLLQASWRFFDDVAARVSAEMAKGPRGGGRDRDQIIRHVLLWEQSDLARKVGFDRPADAPTTPGGHAHAPRTVSRRPPRIRCRGEDGAGTELDHCAPHPAHGLPRPRPRLGDGGQGPLLTRPRS